MRRDRSRASYRPAGGRPLGPRFSGGGRRCARLSLAGALWAALLAAPVRADPASRSWEITLAARIAPQKDHRVKVRLALPFSNDRQRVNSVEVLARGLKYTLAAEDPHPHVVLEGRLSRPRRVAVRARVTRFAGSAAVPPVVPIDDPSDDLLPFLNPAPLFQSRSILVRDFLETYVGPNLRDGKDFLLPVLAATRGQIRHDRRGKSLALDVIRRRRGKRIGIERCFTTFLRCAGVPARFVEGVDLRSKTKRKRVFWTEVWAQGRWWPVSASANFIGTLPLSYVGMARDGTRVVRADEWTEVTYTIQGRRVKEVQK